MLEITFLRRTSTSGRLRPFVAAVVLLALLLSCFMAIHSSSRQARRLPLAADIRSDSPRLFAREDYSCGPGRPCSNGACCGESGFCNYGISHRLCHLNMLLTRPADNVTCGSGCISNCNAKACLSNHKGTVIDASTSNTKQSGRVWSMG